MRRDTLFTNAIIFALLFFTAILTWAQDSRDSLMQKAEAADKLKDYAAELKFCNQLANLKDVRGYSCLGGIYNEGLPGIPKDLKEALKWWRLGAEQGDAAAQWRVAGGNLDGVAGVAVNRAEAVKWNRLAAEQGHPDSQFGLAILYYDGNGIVQDYVQAYMWVNLAIANPNHFYYGVDMMNNMRSQVTRKMTREQIAQGQRLAREWKPKVNKATCGTTPELCPK